MSENDSGRKARKAAVDIGFHTAMFLDRVSGYTGTKKLELYKQIFEAGVQAKFGIDEAELENCVMAAIPAGTPIPSDLTQLTDLICGE